MPRKTYPLSISKTILDDIDNILPKLKYSVNIKKIVSWLENFETSDVSHAIEFLFFLEYIDNAELTFRMEEQLKNALDTIPEDFNVFIYPGVSTYPKSTEVINYILKDTPSYKLRNSREKCKITRDLEKDFDPTTNTAIIFVDDFIGSGKSFEKGYDLRTDLRSWIDKQNAIKARFLIAAICMTEGRQYIANKYSEIKIFSEFRDKIFHSVNSPFRIANNVSKMKSIAEKYGNLIPTKNFPPYYDPLGFENSESLVAFSHTTPNNTLPIIWGGINWYPIYPRHAKDKIKQSKDIKKEAAFFIGIMNRLGLDLYTNENIIINGKRVIKYNSQKDHSLLCVIKLQLDGYETLSICQILGLTISEYKKILNYGKECRFLDREGKINGTGKEFYLKLLKKASLARITKSEKGDFKVKNIIYVPKSFGGVS